MSTFVRVSPILEEADGKLFFDCPGCGMLHGANIEVGGPPRWSWNGSVGKPTFHPSILRRYLWCPLENGEHKQAVCHSFVTGGRIQFLNGCAHHLADQTVGLPQLEGDEWPGLATGSLWS